MNAMKGTVWGIATLLDAVGCLAACSCSTEAIGTESGTDAGGSGSFDGSSRRDSEKPGKSKGDSESDSGDGSSKRDSGKPGKSEGDSGSDSGDGTSKRDSGKGLSCAGDGGDFPPGAHQCASATEVETCGSDGQWGNAWTCVSGTCSVGSCTGSTTGTTNPSCAAGGPGMNNCGPGGSGSESCCASLEVKNALESEASPYYRTYTYGDASSYAYPATVSEFQLDEYLVTVGRFRQFVAAWSGGYYPSSGSGKHTHLNGGLGLVNSASVLPDAGPVTYETGWNATDWNNATDIDPTNGNLGSCGSFSTWTDAAGSQENLPINCVTWYESYAFCIWDGGFLPSEAEWEYAAAAGNQQREYPWGTAAPGTANQYAIYNSYYTGNPTGVAPAGYALLGAGYWGQLDLAGELWEWNLDRYSTYVNPCTDCAYLSATPTPFRVYRGGNFYDTASHLLSPFRDGNTPALRSNGVGFRCARNP